MSERKIAWTTMAQEDLRQIEGFIQKDNPTVAAAMVLKLVKQAESIAHFPFACEAIQPDRPQYRNKIVSPYAVLYEVTDTHIIILRVIHTLMRWK